MLTFTPLPGRFGLSVTGLDLRASVSDADFSALRAAFDQHAVLVLRGRPIDDAQQIAFASRFGMLERTRLGAQGQGSELTILTNIGPDGTVVPPSNRQWINTLANQLWHIDSSFKPIPALASMLSGRIVPARGGETEFIDMRIVWNALPDAWKAEVEGRVAIHNLAHSRAQVDPAHLTAQERAGVPPVRQPMVRTLPSGAKSLYIGSHVEAIEGMAPDVARELLLRLLAFAEQPAHVYTHAWQAHDLLIWDNRATLHRGRTFDPTQPRYLVRATVAGDAPLQEQAPVALEAHRARELVMQ